MLGRFLLGLSALVLVAGTAVAVTSPWKQAAPLIDRAIAYLEPPGEPGGPAKTFRVEPGEGAADIGERLAREGVIQHPWLFRLVVSYRGLGGSLKAGRYRLPSGSSLEDVVQAITEGREDLVAVTVPEGWRAEQVAEAFEAAGVLRREDFLRFVASYSEGRALEIPRPVPSLEGYLFPETYRVPRDAGAREVLDLILATFLERVPERMRAEAARQGMTLHQVITLASIVEREAVAPGEQPLIASVLLNRLKDGFPLAADPTVQYTLTPFGAPAGPEGYWPDLSLEDLRIASPYNTYVTPGLPPTPIAEPGLPAITAVLKPADSPYYFFVAKPDGTHAFASTMAEHLRNVALYQR